MGSTSEGLTLGVSTEPLLSSCKGLILQSNELSGSGGPQVPSSLVSLSWFASCLGKALTAQEAALFSLCFLKDAPEASSGMAS